ncbi:MAG: hypothetical protein RI894_316 [Bacteroidota bacterium]
MFKNQMPKLAILFCAVLFSTAIFAQSYPHLQVSGRFLKSPCGDTIILRGVNYAPYNWGYTQSAEYMSQIAQTGANAVRITWYASNPGTTEYTAANLDTVLARCVRYKMIPIVDLHDQTCADAPAALITTSNYFLQPTISTVLLKYKSSLIINIANEALYVGWANDPVVALQTYISTYNTIVQNYRNANLQMPIMIDAPDCGTNIDAFNTAAATITAADSYHNMLYSGHAYWYSFANNDPIIAQQKLQTAVNNNIPLVLGEIANYQDDAAPCAYLLPYQQLLVSCKALKIGWLAWSWVSDNCASRQMSTNGNVNSLTAFGFSIVNDATTGLLATAVRSPYLLNNSVCVSACQPFTPIITVAGASCPKTLSTSGYTTYLWSNSATTASISAASTGIYTVTVTNAAGCTGTATVLVDCCNLQITEMRSLIYVHAQAVTFPTPTVTGCAAGSVLTYLWDFGDGSTSTLASPTRTYAAVGVYNVCLTVTCTTANGSFCRVKCCRDVNIGKNCPSLYPTFSFTTPATGLAYTFTGTIQSTSVVPAPTSTYEIYNSTNTLLTLTGTNVTYAFPSSGEYTVCRNLAYTADGVSSTANYGAYCANRNCRKLTVMPTTGCNAAAKFVATTYKANPLNVTFNASSYSTGATAYYWEYSTSPTGAFTQLGTAANSILGTPAFLFPSTGVYWVRLTVNKGTACETAIIARINLNGFTCTSSSSTNPNRTINPDGSIEIGNSDINDGIGLYPNPTDSNVTITFGNDIKATTMVKVFDMKGTLIASFRTQEGDSQTVIDLSNQAAGMYLFHIENENGERLVKKVIKE